MIHPASDNIYYVNQQDTMTTGIYPGYPLLTLFHYVGQNSKVKWGLGGINGLWITVVITDTYRGVPTPHASAFIIWVIP